MPHAVNLTQFFRVQQLRQFESHLLGRVGGGIERFGSLPVAQQVGHQYAVAELGEVGELVPPVEGAAGEAVQEEDGRLEGFGWNVGVGVGVSAAEGGEFGVVWESNVGHFVSGVEMGEGDGGNEVQGRGGIERAAMLYLGHSVCI